LLCSVFVFLLHVVVWTEVEETSRMIPRFVPLARRLKNFHSIKGKKKNVGDDWTTRFNKTKQNKIKNRSQENTAHTYTTIQF
jgi:hypothetical protein